MDTARASSGIHEAVARLTRSHHYPVYESGATVEVVFAQGVPPAPGLPQGKPLWFGRNPVEAVTRVSSAPDRATGASDVVITVDAAAWRRLTGPERLAILDQQLERVDALLTREGEVLQDGAGRPSLRLRPFSIFVAGYWENLERHGTASPEYRALAPALRKFVKLTGEQV